MILASILDTFLEYLWASQGNKSGNGETWKTYVFLWFSMVFRDPAVAEGNEDVTFRWSFCGPVAGMPFWLFLDHFWIHSGKLFRLKTQSKTMLKICQFFGLSFFSFVPPDRPANRISRYPADKERKKQRKKPSGVRKLTAQTPSGRAKALGRFPSSAVRPPTKKERSKERKRVRKLTKKTLSDILKD
jgi:hypothetical protein